MATPTPERDLAICRGGLPADIGLVGGDVWYARCGCTETVCAGGTYEEAVAALDAHRNPEPPQPEE